MKQKQKPLSFSLNPLNHAYIEEQVTERKKTNSRYSRSMYMDDLITHLRTRNKPVKKTRAKPLVSVDVEGLNIEAWDKWITYRKIAKLKPYKTDAKKKELATLGDYDDQMTIVMTSINNEYAGLFPLKSSGTGKSVNIDNNLDDTSWANNLDDVL